ncbi:hypothetical protein CDEST_15484 [Colletotrichum destructivum]|uniref:Uncharacterized protein n=1 Tax=Colletotrichum destructivum TaxID=34406 RepID=A0AAX4J4R8_9PEZI|nr:hypothetical protein CDEST_15380 [Colletotrichum destructivum]WQF90470.1 hypothetical protein CDEST_15484 [Colletotrichum destructivum]
MELDLDGSLNRLIARIETEVIASAPTERGALREAKNEFRRCLGSIVLPEVASIALTEVTALSQWLDSYEELRTSSTNMAGPLITPCAVHDRHDDMLRKWASELCEGARGVAFILNVGVEDDEWELVSRTQPKVEAGVGPDTTDYGQNKLAMSDNESEQAGGDTVHNDWMGKFDPMYREWYH